MGGDNKPSNSSKVSDQSLEKKKGFADWMNLMKPGNEEKDHWVKIYACIQHFANLLKILMVLSFACILRPIYYIFIPTLFAYSFWNLSHGLKLFIHVSSILHFIINKSILSIKVQVSCLQQVG
jgi:hypothetical protein